MRRHRYTVACLAGDGIGPELIAEASRALAAVSRLHGFTVEELHLPFGRDAVRRFGHPLPPATRAACRRPTRSSSRRRRSPRWKGSRRSSTSPGG